MRFMALVILFSSVSPAWADCKLSDINIKFFKAEYVDKCKGSPCISMKGVAVLSNLCSEPIGVEIKITGYDKADMPAATRDLWPASIKNIPPGDYTFSLDHWLDYDPDIKTFDLKPVSIKSWR